MASIKQIGERKFKITVSNGYRPDGRKISKAKTITVPNNIRKTSIRQYVDHAAEEMERQVKYAPSTLATYRRMLQRVYPFIGTIPLNRLRPLALENMLIELRKRQNRGKPIQEVTVQKHLSAVSAVLSDAKRNEIIRKNPAHMIDLPETERKEQLIPTEKEAERFIQVLLDEPWHYKTFYLLAIYTGCRRGELCALKWSDFVMDGYRSILTINRSRNPVLGEGVQEGKTKNGRSRIIVIDEDITSFVRNYCMVRKQEAKDNKVPFSPYFFTNADGSFIHPDTFTRHLRKIFKENDFPENFHLHTLRHYFVSTLLHHGVDKQTVADLAGHADTSFLERTYCHPQLELKKEAAIIMTDVLLYSNSRSPKSA